MKKNQSKATLLSRAARVMQRLKAVRGMTEIEKSFCALGIAATPEERWQINQLMLQRLPAAAKRWMAQESIESARIHERLQGIGGK
jgi:hypothetical protein